MDAVEEAVKAVDSVDESRGAFVRVGVIRLEPGDQLLVRLVGKHTNAVKAQIAGHMSSRFPSNPCLVVDDDISIEVIRPKLGEYKPEPL